MTDFNCYLQEGWHTIKTKGIHYKESTMPNLLAVKPQTYLQILKQSISIYRQSFLHVYWVSLIISLVVFIPRLILTFFDPHYFNSTQVFDAHMIWFFLSEIVGVFFFIILLWRMYSVLMGVDDKVREDLNIATHKIWPILGAVLLQVVIFLATAAILYFFYQFIFTERMYPKSATIALIALTLYILLEFYLIFLFVFYLLLIVIENKGIIASLKKSAQLVWGLWWRNFWILMTPFLCYTVFLIFIRYILAIDLPIYFIDSHPSSKWIPIFYMFLFSLFIPWNAAILITQMRDLELRKKL